MKLSTARIIERRNGDLQRRRGLVRMAKRLLPLVAVMLLALLMAWPSLRHDAAIKQISTNPKIGEPASGQMSNGRYNGVNDAGEPFTVTAVSANQADENKVNLLSPVGDISQHGGSWLQVKGQRGVYDQQTGQLDLAGDVVLYRDDGTRMESNTVTVDTKQSAATSADQVHAEGPFGTLDAQGFALLDSGAVIQFTGPGRLVLQGAQK